MPKFFRYFGSFRIIISLQNKNSDVSRYNEVEKTPNGKKATHLQKYGEVKV